MTRPLTDFCIWQNKKNGSTSVNLATHPPAGWEEPGIITHTFKCRSWDAAVIIADILLGYKDPSGLVEDITEAMNLLNLK